jgi:DNA helicase-2/ATP-dependent DNA helicase PcrA
MEIWAGTFHHIGNRVLRRAATLLGYTPNFTILDTEDQHEFVRLAMEHSGLVGTGKLVPRPAQIHHLIGYVANVGCSLVEHVTGRHPDLLAWLPRIEKTAAEYGRRKHAANCMDYDDLLAQWVRLIDEFPEQRAEQGNRFKHILIDELQDTNASQVRLVEAIAEAGSKNLTAVGDDAQSIYRFRGADYDNILKFPERHRQSRSFRLETNYRSTPEIVALTNASIKRNRTGFAKKLVSARTTGTLPTVSQRSTRTQRRKRSASGCSRHMKKALR